MHSLYHLIDAGWKVIAWTLVIVGVHIAWFWLEREPAIFQRSGAALVVLGAAVAARAFLREGTSAAIERRMPRLPGLFPVSHQTLVEAKKRSEARRPEIERDVRAEGIWAFWLITIGTALSGYGDLLPSLWKWAHVT